jgi:branched-chain amino acid transport system permease protein
MLANPVFLFTQTLNALSLGMNLFLIAAGLTLIFGVLRVVNFAHGAFFMLGAYICYSTVQWVGGRGLSFWLGIIAAGLGLALLGWIIERTLLRRLYGHDPLTQLLFTFALVLILGDLAKLVWGTDQYSVPYPSGLDRAVNLGITYYPRYLLFLCATGPLVALSLWYVLGRTRWGRIIRAATQDREMLSALGVDVRRVYAGVFAAGSALAGMGGALAAPRMGLSPGMDATIVIESFIVVIIGGLGSLWGSFFGALILGFTTVFGAVLFPEWEMVLTYLLMVAVLLWRPWGLFGRPETGADV